jgi:D-alanyl-D-alanine carboxypeptidase (penicillin-binding protein 5/6)
MTGRKSTIMKKMPKYTLNYCMLFIIIFNIILFTNPNKSFGLDSSIEENSELLCDVYEFEINNEDSVDDYINVTAESAIVMEYDTGEILWEKNSSSSMYPASITKILTAIVAIENIDNFNETITISKNASGRNNSFFRFDTGDEISLIDLLKASLISSHNNATIALAEYVSGSVDDFVKLMNLKAREIGAKDTFFQNTNGLDTEFSDHKTTSKDIAIITKYCLEDNLFRNIVNISEDVIEINDEEIEIFNTNKLLEYDYIKGVKTGYTKNAGFCLVIYSEKDALNTITVILNSLKDNREKDALNINNWIYNNFKYIEIVNSDNIFKNIKVGDISKVEIDLYPDSDFTKLINTASDEIYLEDNLVNNFDLPVLENQIFGTLDININGNSEKELKLITKDTIEEPFIYQELSTENERQSRKYLFFIITFYFFVFTFIIIRNLFSRKIY